MQIQCLIERSGGTEVDIGGRQYHFRPNADGHHVCEVEDKVHLQRFMAISEAYCLYDGKSAKEAASVSAAPVVEKPIEQMPSDNGEGVIIEDVYQEPSGPLESWTHDQLFEFAEERMGIEDPEDEDELKAYAEEQYGLKLSKTMKASTMIMRIIEASRQAHG